MEVKTTTKDEQTSINKQNTCTIILLSRWFEFMGRGDFVLYKNTERNFEVSLFLLLKRKLHVGRVINRVVK